MGSRPPPWPRLPSFGNLPGSAPSYFLGPTSGSPASSAILAPPRSRLPLVQHRRSAQCGALLHFLPAIDLFPLLTSKSGPKVPSEPLGILQQRLTRPQVFACELKWSWKFWELICSKKARFTKSHASSVSPTISFKNASGRLSSFLRRSQIDWAQ